MKAKFSLTSVVLIAALSGIIGWLAGVQHTTFIDRVAARDLLYGQIAIALESYRSDHGSYPTAEQGLSVLLGTNGGQAYFSGEMKDPQGRPVQYFLVSGKPVVGFFTGATSESAK